jgi:hypothetical protein
MKVTDRKSPDFGKLLPNPAAENIENLPGGYNYYLRQVGGKKDDYINVFLLGQYGSTMHGKPVYSEWNDTFHVAPQPLLPIQGQPIIMAFDFGLTPAAVFGQVTPMGQLLVLNELVSEDMGIRQFYSDVVLPFRMQHYARFRFDVVGDPAGNTKAQTDAKTCFQELADLGVVCEGAFTNEFTARRESVAYFLNRASAGRAGFQLSPSCKVLRKGFNGGYRYERVQASGATERFKDRPVKDKFSHPHDALQYLCLYVRGDANPVRARPVKKPKMGAWT